MRRRNLILDFTSLLDVILIILFIVIGSINQASIMAGQVSASALTDAQAKISSMEQEISELQSKLDEAIAELAVAKTESNYDPSDTSNTVDLLKGITKVVLNCDTAIDLQTKNPSVQVNISTVRNSTIQEELGTVTFFHDLSLTNTDREQLRSEQIKELSNMLIDGLKSDPIPVFWLTVQFTYEDPNFTKFDIDAIHQAVDTAQLQLGKTFYTDEYHKN